MKLPKNKNPLLKVESLLPKLKENTLLTEKVNEITKLFQNGHSFTDKELLNINISCFEYQYPFYCKIDSNNEVKKLFLKKKGTLIQHIKREVRFNNCEIHYNKIQYYRNQETSLINTKTKIDIKSNPKHADSLQAFFSNCVSLIMLLIYFISTIIKFFLQIADLFFPATAILFVIVFFWLLIALDSELFNIIFWSTTCILFGCFILYILADIIDSRNQKKLEKAKELKQIELEKALKIRQEKLENLRQLKHKEIQILKSMLRKKY